MGSAIGRITKTSGGGLESPHGRIVSEDVNQVEPTKEALEFAKTIVETKAIAGIVIVGSIVMDVHGGIPQIVQGGQEWQRNIAVIAEQYAQQREHAAYERGKAEGREAGKQEERARCLAILNARRQTAAISQERANAQFDWQGATYHQRAELVIKDLINIVNQE